MLPDQPQTGASLFDLTGRTALVTGATGHLGTALATALSDAGATVLLGGRHRGRLDDLTAALEARGGRAVALAVDVEDPASIGEAAAAAMEVSPRLDVLVSNAHFQRSAAFDTVRAADFARAAAVSAGAAHELVQALLPALRRGRDESPSSVITIASMYGKVSPDPRNYADPAHQNPADYGAAKAALLQYTRHAAVHLAHEGIRVNAISPGPFPRAEAADPAFLERLADRVPLGRIGTAGELATAVLFLASPASSFVTGIDVPVDGGWTAW